MKNLSNTIKPVATITDKQQELYDYRLYETKQQLKKLADIYYGDETSYLPYTHDKKEVDGKTVYVFNPSATAMFIQRIAEYYEEAYVNKMYVPLSDNEWGFFKSFLYLAIRIGCPGWGVMEYYEYGMIDRGTFDNLYTIALLSDISYTEEYFHRTYEIGIKEMILPGMFHDIEHFCEIIGKPGCYLHPPVSEEEQIQALKEDEEKRRLDDEENAKEMGMTIEEFYQMIDNVSDEEIDLIIKDENNFINSLPKFKDADNFVKHACYYRDHLFEGRNNRISEITSDALRLFLMHNGHSLLGDDKAYLQAHAEVSLTIDDLIKRAKHL